MNDEDIKALPPAEQLKVAEICLSVALADWSKAMVAVALAESDDGE